MVYDPFNILLGLICWYSVDFCVCVCEGYWLVIFFLFCDTFGSAIRVMMAWQNIFRSVSSSATFWNGFRRIGINSSLNVYSICLWSHLSWTFVCYSVPKSCPTLWDPMDHSTPGFPVFHCLPEIAQTHVHWVNDAIQSYHPLSPASLPALNVFPASGSFPVGELFASGQSIGTSGSVLSVNIQGWFLLGLTGLTSLLSKQSAPAPQFESISSLALSLFSVPTLTSTAKTDVQEYSNASFLGAKWFQ